MKNKKQYEDSMRTVVYSTVGMLIMFIILIIIK